MSNMIITDTAKLIYQLSRFTAFIQQMDGQPGFISFRDSSGFLGREEDYKSRIAEEARKELNYSGWNESWIGSGKIAECAKRAMGKAGNLVNKNQQIDFRNRLDPEHPKYRPEAERVLFDLYRNPLIEESVSFENAVRVFGGKYDTIAFLFFIKDDSRFLPISTGHFDKGFEILNINYSTSYHCEWTNYQGFIGILKEIRTVMEDMLPMQGTPRLIDAHSFVWIIQEEKYKSWGPDENQIIQIEQSTESYIDRVISGTGGRRTINSSAFIRSADVVKETRNRAHGICQLCNQLAPFFDKKGNRYGTE